MAALQILVVGDPDIGSRLVRAWQSEGHGEAKVVELTDEQWVDKNLAIDPEVDVVVFPSNYLADLGSSEMLLEVPAVVWNGQEINKAELLNHFRSGLTRYGNKVVAAPLGAPELLLVYREDVLKAAGLQPPDTWEQFDQLAEKLAAAGELKNAEGQELPRTVAQPMNGEWPASVLLSRVAGAVTGHGRLSTIVNVETLHPLIESAPFEAALRSMIAIEKSRRLSGNQQTFGDPADVFEALVSGRAAVGITWPSARFADKPGAGSPHLHVRRLPATGQWFDQVEGTWNSHGADDQPQVDFLGFDGMWVGVSKNSLHANAAIDFLAWMSSKRISLQLSSQSKRTGPFRASQLADPVRWVGESLTTQAAEEYANAIRETHEARLIMNFPRLPGQREYVQALANSIRAACEEKQSPAESLQHAANEFNRITTKFGGPAAQSRSLRHAEGY